MKRRHACIGAISLSLDRGLALAQQSAKRVPAQRQDTPRRLGHLVWSNPAADKAARADFTEDFAKLGWFDGRNIISKVAYANGDAARMDALAAELIAFKPDVITVNNALGALALQRATRTIPIVFTGPIDPVGLGLVKSLHAPGGNVTGMAGIVGYELHGKRLQLFKEWLPGMSRVAVMHNPLEPENMTTLPVLRRYATQFGLQVQDLRLRDAAGIDGMFAELQRNRPDAVYLLGNAVTVTYREAIVSRLVAARIPATSGYTVIVEAGCLFGYLTLIRDYSKELARYVDQILRGAKPADLPVIQPLRYELVINAKTAKALGLAIPRSLLLRADRVVD